MASPAWAASMDQESPSVSLKQEGAPLGNITLYEAIRRAEQDSPGLKAAYAAWKAAEKKAPQNRALPFPQLDLGFSWRRSGEDSYPAFRRIGLMQHFHWFGKLGLMGSMAEKEAGIFQKQYELAKLELVFNVTTAYCDYYLSRRRVEIMEENLALLNNSEKVVRRMYAAGGASFSDLLRVQVEGDKLGNELESMKRMMAPTRTRLLAFMGRPSDPSPLIPAPPEIPVAEPDPRETLEHLFTHNPALLSMNDMIAMRDLNIRLARRNVYPDFSIGVEYMFNDATGMASMNASPGVSEPLSAMISFKIPLWSGKNRAALKEAEILREQALREKERMGDEMTSRLDMAMFEYSDALRKISLYRDRLLPRSREASDVARTAYGAGKASFMDFIDTQRMQLELELELEAAETTAVKRLAEIAMLTGRPAVSSHTEIKGESQ